MLLHLCVFVSVEYNMTGETGKMEKRMGEREIQRYGC